MAEWWTDFFGPNYLAWYHAQTAVEARDQVQFVAGLLPDGPVLDVCCGYGRHSRPLAELGFATTGLDYSGFLLREAHRLSASLARPPRWVQGDMRRLPFDATFTGVVNLFTSFGYFDDPADDRAALREMARVLAPGGCLVLDLINRDFLVRNPTSDWWEEDGRFYLQKSEIDWTRDMATSENIIIHGESVQRFTHRVRLYSLAAVRRLFEDAGLALERVYGGLDGRGFGSGSAHIVAVGRAG